MKNLKRASWAETVHVAVSNLMLSALSAWFDFYASAFVNAANVRSSVRSNCSGVTDTRPDATTAVSLSAAFSRGPR